MMTLSTSLFNVLVLLSSLLHIDIAAASSWSEWWTYDGISGPDFWGLVNNDWSLCTKGRRQSPIDIDPKLLLFDPSLKPIKIVNSRISGRLLNTGHDIRLIFDEPSPHYVNISAGPFPYQYRVSELIIHFGISDSTGSEHTINGVTFPAEVQILCYNSDLYGNVSHALHATNGLAIISLLAQVKDHSLSPLSSLSSISFPSAPSGQGPITPQSVAGDLSKTDARRTNAEFEVIVEHLKSIRYKGEQVRVRHVALHELIPTTDDYVTYDGSMTQPGCQETVTWVIVNRPLYITSNALKAMRDVMQGDENQAGNKVSLGNNYRPIMPTNQRTVRTNINFQSPTQSCTMDRQVFYRTNLLEAGQLSAQ